MYELQENISYYSEGRVMTFVMPARGGAAAFRA